MKRPLAAALVVASLVIIVPFALASGPQITGGLIGTGVITAGTAQATFSADKGIVMEWAKLPPGTSFGWHYHRAPVAVVVTAGTLTLYDSSDQSCSPHRYAAGQGFVEPAHHVHVARNEGSKTVSLYAVYLGVGAQLRTNATPLDVYVKSPGNCPASVS